MPTEVKIPSLGESIVSGILASWKVKEGEFVRPGQPLYDLETDKITSEGLAEAEGLIHLQVAEGAEVKIGAVVATITESAAPAQPGDAGSGPPATAAGPGAKPSAAPRKAPAGETAAAHPPSVRRLAAESGIDPGAVPGSGKGGRVTKGDMLQAIAQASAPPPDPAPSPAPPPAKPVPETVPQPPAAGSSDPARISRTRMSPLRRRIAERLVEVQQSAAILSTFNEVDMSAVMELRRKHQEAFVSRHGVKLGFMSFFVKAVVDALKEVPALNARIEGEEIIHHHFYDIGVAVSTPRGLLVPVIRDCDRLGFAAIEQALAEYGKRAKEGKIGIEDLQGGVFTISNGGIFGSLLSTPIINPPQSGILGMHAIKDRPVAVQGQVVIRPMMYLALSYDHRLVDGREAVTFLVRIKDALEDPSRLLLQI